MWQSTKMPLDQSILLQSQLIDYYLKWPSLDKERQINQDWSFITLLNKVFMVNFTIIFQTIWAYLARLF